jgi:maleate isomerase
MKDYYGWRARIGLIYMASSTVMEPEFYAMAPEGVSIHTDRIILPAPTIAGLEEMMKGEEVRRCASFLAQAPLHVIMFGGTSATFLHGIGWDRKVIEQMATVANGIPTSTSSSAVLNALTILGAKKISLLTPYLDVVTARASVFLEANGFAVLSSKGLNIGADHAIGAVPLEQVYDFARHNCHLDSDALFLSCTNWRTAGAIDALEKDLGIPVISAIQASFWECLRIAKIGDGGTGFGRLFQYR